MSRLASNLAAEINIEHERAFGKAREALDHARRAGELLLQAKVTVGQFVVWVRKDSLSDEDRTKMIAMGLPVPSKDEVKSCR
jgi:hypothetical protein